MRKRCESFVEKRESEKTISEERRKNSLESSAEALSPRLYVSLAGAKAQDYREQIAGFNQVCG